MTGPAGDPYTPALYIGDSGKPYGGFGPARPTRSHRRAGE